MTARFDDTQLTARGIARLTAAGDTAAVRQVIEPMHPADLAEALAGLEPADLWRVLSLLPLERQAETFAHLPPAAQVGLAGTLPRATMAKIFAELPADDRADLFNRLSAEQQEALLPALSSAEREDVRRLAAYREDTAGAIMTSDYALLQPGLTAAQAIETLRREAPDKETIYRAYVVDDARRLIGSVRLQSLILAPPGARVEDLMERDTHAVRVDDDQEDVARRIARYDVLALPVVDHDGRLVGIVTYDDAMDVAEAEATEDFHRMAHVQPLESVRDAAIGVLYRRRIVWLVLLVFGNLFSGAGIAYFEDTIATYIALVFFLPLLIDSAGNAGAQASTLMVRALATGDVAMTDWGRLFGKEFVVAAALGLTMALAISPIGIARGGPQIALVVGLSMIVIVMVGSLIGMCLPFVLSRFRLDPATASAPLVTSIADAAGVLIYFSIATWWLTLT
jgi:magnesium transporter